MTRDPWKLVMSVDELRVGLCVEFRTCVWCGRKDRTILLRKTKSPTGLICLPGGDRIPDDGSVWIVARRCRLSSKPHRPDVALGPAIRERRLYALIDDDTAADETTVTRRREMVE
jgi:hypothetical protein